MMQKTTPGTLIMDRLKKDEAGMVLIEALISLIILGLISASFLGSLATGAKATITAAEQTTAESLARSELEFIKQETYAAEYSINPSLTLPSPGWVVTQPVVTPVYATGSGIQKITVAVLRNGKEIIELTTFKVNR